MLDENQKNTINDALKIISDLYQREPLLATSPELVKQFCQLHLGYLEHEVFGVLFLDNRHQLIKYSALFRGTINGAAVYPREISKEALFANAAAVILTHNHPSGICEPSEADKRITVRLVEALGLFDIRVLDHIIASNQSTMSFAEHGLL